MADLEPIKAAVEPVAEQIHRLIEEEIQRRLEPLEERDGPTVRYRLRSRRHRDRHRG